MDKVGKVTCPFHPDERFTPFQDFRDSEVEKLDSMLFLCDVDIPAADVIMEKSVEVDVIQSREKFSDYAKEFLFIKDEAESLKKFPSIDKIHRKEVVLGGDQMPVDGPDGTEIVDSHDVGMAERAQDLKFLFEVFQARGLRHIKVYDLDDDIGGEGKIPGFVDNTHGAFSYLGDDGIPIIYEFHIL
jgi:hypothetical protein